MKHFKVLCLTVISLLYCIFLGSAAAGDNSFTDVPVTHWAYGAVQSLSKAGIVRGFPDGYFRPDQKVTREQFATVLVKTLDLPLNEKAPQIFADIREDHRSFAYIDAAKSFIPVPSNPMGKYNFGPGRNITREEVAEALALALDLKPDPKAPAVNLQSMFRDYGSIAPEFRERVALAVSSKIMSGRGNGRFDPKGGLTRAELCAVLNKLIQEKQVPPKKAEPGAPDPSPGSHIPWTIEFNFTQPDWDLVKCFTGSVVTKVYRSSDSYMVLENATIVQSGSSVSVKIKTVNMCVYEEDLAWFFPGDALTVNFDRKNHITSYKLEKEGAPHTYLPPVPDR